MVLANPTNLTGCMPRSSNPPLQTSRLGQNRIYTPYMAVLLVIPLPKTPYTHRIYMVLANPTNLTGCMSRSPNPPLQTSQGACRDCMARGTCGSSSLPWPVGQSICACSLGHSYQRGGAASCPGPVDQSVTVQKAGLVHAIRCKPHEVRDGVGSESCNTLQNRV